MGVFLKKNNWFRINGKASIRPLDKGRAAKFSS
jgi:hypothetical protein